MARKMRNKRFRQMMKDLDKQTGQPAPKKLAA
ncbi:hypothetical protein Fbal_2151 [Ferrimonas balearica DSM 9799]|uniref:Uncharacterized protein n=1 Tax=Ferrimonas balearica (strain DSM 9799 / CCM 4581 / KCTC 23876 / PAT) TaxID=550540 RepID=E1SVM3_FERBD|nr:hypothetical protein Fbal_2151 [Ferrimonas balearica DSM 9799]